jgi:hypothetical protein
MLWFSIGVIALLLLYAAVRAKKMAPLFADDHLTELLALLPELKRTALAGQGGPPPSARTSALAVAYTISRGEAGWVHHLSVSNMTTPARAAGTFFLGLLRGALRLEEYPAEAFVSQGHVFHLVVRLSEEQEKVFADRSIDAMGPGELRGLAMAGRSALLPRLEERAVPDGR